MRARRGAASPALIVTAALLVAALIPGCRDGGQEARYATPPRPRSTTQRTLLPDEIAVGLKLLPGEDGTLPVRVRWVADRELAEAMAVDGDVLYVMGDELTAFNLRDGTVAWQYEERDAIEADGGVVIGLDGPDVVRVFAPYNYELRVARRTGRLLSRKTAVGGLPPGFVPLPAPQPTRFRIATTELLEIVASWPDGRVAWRLVADKSAVDPLGPLQVGDGIVLATAEQQIVVLDPVAA